MNGKGNKNIIAIKRKPLPQFNPWPSHILFQKHYNFQINYCSIGALVLLYQSNMFHCFMADINGEYEECMASESTLLYHQEDAS